LLICSLIQNSKEEVQFIKDKCDDTLTYYSEKDDRIPPPDKNFWDSWDKD
jgi:hypothetical protein